MKNKIDMWKWERVRRLVLKILKLINMKIYNPIDSLWNEYFIITDIINRNSGCLITEKDYEMLCNIKWVNPIYPTNNVVVSKVKIRNSNIDWFFRKPDTIQERIIKKRLSINN